MVTPGCRKEGELTARPPGSRTRACPEVANSDPYRGPSMGVQMSEAPKRGNAKECLNYRTIALISHASKVMLKILLTNQMTSQDQGMPGDQNLEHHWRRVRPVGGPRALGLCPWS